MRIDKTFPPHLFTALSKALGGDNAATRWLLSANIMLGGFCPYEIYFSPRRSQAITLIEATLKAHASNLNSSYSGDIIDVDVSEEFYRELPK